MATTNHHKGAHAMASSNSSITHSNPNVQRVLDYAARKDAQGITYPSAAALCRAAADHHNMPALGTKAVGRAVRQVWRDTGKGCGRGHTYGQQHKGRVAQGLQQARKAQVQQAKRAGQAPRKQATPAA